MQETGCSELNNEVELMAKEVLDQIKKAEEQAKEKRRVAIVSAKESIKLAEQENSEIKDKELTKARHDALEYVNKEEEAAKKELDALQDKRTQECEELKKRAEGRLEEAAKVCLERILG